MRRSAKPRSFGALSGTHSFPLRYGLAHAKIMEALSWNHSTWPSVPIDGFTSLYKHIHEMTAGKEVPHPFIWRGVPRSSYMLQTVLDRHLQARHMSKHDHVSISREVTLLKRFQALASSLGSDIEKRYLNGEVWDSPDVWSVMAVARHSGLPTRLLDWTHSPWIAAYFACVTTSLEDAYEEAAIVWLEQKPLEKLLHGNWDAWNVPLSADYYSQERNANPKRLGRALEARAFLQQCVQWVSKLHFSLPFERLEKQQACFTVCGRILTDQNDAFDWMDPDGTKVPRGRILIPAELKRKILTSLEEFNVRSTSLGFPAADIVARSVGSDRDAG